VILGGGVAVCLLLSAHRAVVFAITQLYCITTRRFASTVYAVVMCVCVRVCQSPVLYCIEMVVRIELVFCMQVSLDLYLSLCFRDISVLTKFDVMMHLGSPDPICQ